MRTAIAVAFALTILLNSSCTRRYYAPVSANIPLLQQKGDGHLSANLVAGVHEMEGFELQGAYAINNKVGLIVNSLYVSMNFEEDHKPQVRAKYAELGLGRFKSLQNNWLVETYAGIGGGNIHNFYKIQSPTEVVVRKVFVQPNFGYRGKIIDFGISSRISAIDAFAVDNIVTLDETLAQINKNGILWRFEPGFKLGLGYQQFRIYSTINFSLIERDDLLPQEEATGSLGLIFYFK